MPGRYRVLFDYSKPTKARKEVALEVEAGRTERAAAES
jgi:hypothetical protein